MGVSSDQEERRMSVQEMNKIYQTMKCVGDHAVAQTRRARIQSEQYRQQYIDNQKINIILENQKKFSFGINTYSLTRIELDVIYNNLYRELKEYYAQGY